MTNNTNYHANFETLMRAFKSRHVVLVEALPSAERPAGAFICAVNLLPDGSRELVPFAQMLDGPEEPMVLPPTPDAPPSPFGIN